MGSAIVYTMVFILVNSVAHSSYHYENLPAAGYMTLSNGEIYDPFTSTDPNAPPGDLSYDFDSHAPTAGLGIYPDAEFPDIYFDPSDIPSEVDWSRFYPTLVIRATKDRVLVGVPPMRRPIFKPD